MLFQGLCAYFVAGCFYTHAARDRFGAGLSGTYLHSLPGGNEQSFPFCRFVRDCLFCVGGKVRFGRVACHAVGEWLVLTFILWVLAYMVSAYLRNSRFFYISLFSTLLLEGVGLIVSYYFYEFNLLYIAWPLLIMAVLATAGLYFKTLKRRLWIAVVFALLSCFFLESVDYAFTRVLEPHQRTRIEVALGITEDPMGVGYNVNQSKIAIGSGGFVGKGFLNGTQTKLRYVPEQDTDFIFCTIGEEQGFVGTVGVLLLFGLLLVRIIQLAERQRSVFGRVYGYCVAAIIFFHLAVNIGMVIGVLPVIGIPLPFFSYGGSSLWGFTILLFTLLCIDASRSDSL